ncbi:MAG TPA: PVC-type heme-binding CxxCH protein [Pirellulales bacterium]|nr:PVC-type heme-binding CxxCH protein [Pirellulales bacterium]
MNRFTPVAIAIFATPFLTARGGEPVQLNGHAFRLPEGFAIEQIAGPPLVDRPITADFDEQGRLYVSDSSGSNDPVQKQLAEKPHRIVRLEDTDGDGHFDRSTVFADTMMFPEGTMWFDGSLYVAAPPSIWKLTDTDDDGIADRREEWFNGQTLTGCANDLHGPYLGPDGWIYWCKGAFAEQTYERPGKPPLVTRASHIFRRRPEGGPIEPVMTGGMDNPVDVVFTPGGERIFTTTFLQHPGGGLRDGLIHAIYGGVYGKVHGVLDGHPRTSSGVMPVLAHLGPAAPCGLTAYPSNVFGDDYRDNLFAACFNMQKVTRHVLTPDGATFKTTTEDFLVSDNHDFHPTDVLADADGSLVVVDTGGWYKLCCPTSQLVKPDVLGAVYRVYRPGAAAVNDPRGLKLEWTKAAADELAKRLDDPRPAVYQRAIDELGRRGREALPILEGIVSGSCKERAQRGAVWAATRIDDPGARAVVRRALIPKNTVRQAAIHSVSLWRDADAITEILGSVAGDLPQHRRAAAEALGRFGDKRHVQWLLYALTEFAPGDKQMLRDSVSSRIFEHSITFALIEIGDPVGTAWGLGLSDPRAVRAALIALDQMPEGGLTAEQVASYLSHSDATLRQAAVWIVGRHPEWGEVLAGHLGRRLADAQLSGDERGELDAQLARLAASPAIQSLLTRRLSDTAASSEERQSVLRAMAASGLKEPPADWITGLTHQLATTDRQVVPQVIATVRALPINKEKADGLPAALIKISSDATNSADTRAAALAAVPGGLVEVSPEIFAFLLEQLDADRPVSLRAAAVEVFSKARLSGEQLAAIAERIDAVGPLEIDRLLTAFEKSSDAEVGRRLVAALDGSAALGALRVETLKPRLDRFGEAIQPEAEKLYARLSAGAAEQKARLEELLESLPTGDVRRGQAVFNSAKAACVSCHTIGYLGGKLGPDLTRIGQVRNRRDLLESIVFPSASLVRSYEPVMVVTDDGRTENGLLTKDGADEVVLVKSPTEQIHIARDRIEEMQPGKISIMPQGLEQQITPQQLADLVAFLQACK